MSTFDGTNHYFSGQGVAMIGSRDPVTGTPLGLRPVGNVPDLKISVNTTVVDHKGSQDGQRATDARLQTEVKVQVTMTIENWVAINLAKATRGDDTIISAGSVVNEAINCYSGLVTGFKRIKVSSVVVKQASTTLVAYTDGTTTWDYKLNADAGSILINDAALIGLASLVPTSPVGVLALTVSYSFAKQFLVDALTQPLTDNWIRFEGLNTAESNDPVIVDIYRFQNDPLKELALLSDTFGQFVLEGVCLKDDTRLSGSKYFSVKKLN